MPMVVLFTDFGMCGPYVGQVKAVLHQQAPEAFVVDLFADAPVFAPQPSAYLLAAYVGEFPAGTIFLCVVDPGVGSERRGAVVRADERWYVGPDNDLFTPVARRAHDVQWWDILWRPERLSATFHGRDVFAPVAACLAKGEPCPGAAVDWRQRIAPEWPDDLPQVVYIDRFGNAMTGLRAAGVPPSDAVVVGGRNVRCARTYTDVPAGEAFWYANANGLLEIAISRGNAAKDLGLCVGAPVSLRR
jgi:S-adenosylmethionine hydrolase